MADKYAVVRILDIAYQADRAYVYFIPDKWRSLATVGASVAVPFGRGNRHVTGIITNITDECDVSTVKPIFAVIRDGLCISKETIELCLFMRSRYYCSFASALKATLPPGTGMRGSISYSAVPDISGFSCDKEKAIYEYISKNGLTAENVLTSEFGDESRTYLDMMVASELLVRSVEPPHRNEKTVTLVRLTVSDDEAMALIEGSTLTEKQKELAVLLMHYPRISVTEIGDIAGISPSVINTACKKGFCEKVTERVERVPYAELEDLQPDDRPMNEEQKYAYDSLTSLASAEGARAALLLGVTGSGKTKVITETVKNVLQSGKTAIILLPEIGLTAQAMRTYRAAFGKDLAIIHSMLSAGERIDTYRAISEDRIKVVLGTRSAVFAPLKNIGIIVIDEEQEATYKSELTPKYHARDIASFRAGYHGCLLLLSSATPSMESYYKATKGIYSLIRLTKRASGQELPEVLIEDIRGDSALLPDKLVGTLLSAEINRCINNGKQAILFSNRRGFNSQISCRSCGHVIVCPNCSVSLTYHAYAGENISLRKLACHYCGYTAPVPNVCPVCGGKHLSFLGSGTQKLQDEITEKFPEVPYIRMDADTTAVRYSHDRLFDSFRSGQAKLLFGTQMVCKGLDFPEVTLAAVVSVDSLLYMNDFRASERTFSLLTQLIGRAGRAGSKGKAILQTMNPEHEVLRLAATQDYEVFAQGELKLRKAVSFPPFCGIAAFTVSAASEEELEAYLPKFRTEMSRYTVSEDAAKIMIFGPYREGIYKIGGMFRQKVIIKYSDNSTARKYLSDVYTAALTRLPQGIRLDLDINPTVV